MRSLPLALAAAVSTAAAAGGIPDDGFLEQYAATYRFRLGRPTAVQPAPDGTAVLFLRSGPRSFERVLYEYDVAARRERVLLTARDLLGGEEETLTPEERARRERRRLVARGIASYQLSRDGGRVLLPLSGRLFVLQRPRGSLREIATGGMRAAVPRLSPDGDRIAYVSDRELHVVETAGGPPRRLTEGAGDTVSHGLAEFVAQEEMGRHAGFWWSPDSTRLVYQRTDTAGVEMLSIMDATDPRRPPRRWPYPRPGGANADVRLGVVAVRGGPTTWIEWDRRRHPYLATVTWPEHAPLTILVQNREQTEEVLLAVDPASGRTRPLLVERDDAWVDIDQRMPHWLADGSAFLWTTERRGEREIELRDADGSLREVLTPPGAGLRRFVHIDEARGVLYAVASPDPTETHLVRVPAGGGAAARLTTAPGNHDAVFSENGDVFVHRFSGPSGERARVRRADGEVLGELRSVAETPPFDVSAELVTAGDDPALHAVLIRPRDFDPDRRYPVIVHVYGGPTGLMVTRSRTRYLLDQWIADHGYVVVSIDGRGTPGRGRVWRRAVKGDLIDLPLRDQAEGLRALGEAFDELDLSRVGIYGWSFGGYFSAMAVMRRPDVFHAGVAGAPVVDWRDYDTHYTERYMGLPRENPSGYEAASVLTWAADLSRPLLIIHGTADDNVHFLHSLKLADTLFRAGRPFELLPLAGFTHMVPDPLVTQRLYTRIMAFFDEHLKGRP